MHILLTGSNGYIGKRLLPILLQEGHKVTCLLRQKGLEVPEEYKGQVNIVYADLLKPKELSSLPLDIDFAYYLVHSMGEVKERKQLKSLEIYAAKNFVSYLEKTKVKQLIYLTGLSPEEKLSFHLESRKNVEDFFLASSIPATSLRAGIIIGSGSASFEIIRDLVEKLPVMIAPKWLNNKCQPIAISDVLYYLIATLGEEKSYNKRYDIAGPDVLTFKEILKSFSKLRGLRRFIFTIPVLTPRLSSYWLYFVTSVNFSLAKYLVDSVKNNVVKKNNSINDIIKRDCLSFDEAVKRSFKKIEQNLVLSSWKDNWQCDDFPEDMIDLIKVPEYACLKDLRYFELKVDVKEAYRRIWTIGGDNGWYTLDWSWRLRGFLDKLVGGVGLRRGRRDPYKLNSGDTLDFWRVILADKRHMRLLLYAEMKLPGEAWLEFHIQKTDSGYRLKQEATFRPKGLLGRIYWYSLAPIHPIIFKSMAKAIAVQSKRPGLNQKK